MRTFNDHSTGLPPHHHPRSRSNRRAFGPAAFGPAAFGPRAFSEAGDFRRRSGRRVVDPPDLPGDALDLRESGRSGARSRPGFGARNQCRECIDPRESGELRRDLGHRRDRTPRDSANPRRRNRTQVDTSPRDQRDTNHPTHQEHRATHEAITASRRALRNLAQAYLAAVSSNDPTHSKSAQTILATASDDLHHLLADQA